MKVLIRRLFAPQRHVDSRTARLLSLSAYATFRSSLTDLNLINWRPFITAQRSSCATGEPAINALITRVKNFAGHHYPTTRLLTRLDEEAGDELEEHEQTVELKTGILAKEAGVT